MRERVGVVQSFRCGKTLRVRSSGWVRRAWTGPGGGRHSLILMVPFRHYQCPEPELTPEQLAKQDAANADDTRCAELLK